MCRKNNTNKRAQQDTSSGVLAFRALRSFYASIGAEFDDELGPFDSLSDRLLSAHHKAAAKRIALESRKVGKLYGLHQAEMEVLRDGILELAICLSSSGPSGARCFHLESLNICQATRVYLSQQQATSNSLPGWPA